MTIHVIAVVRDDTCKTETLTVAFHTTTQVASYIDEVFQLYGDDAAVALAVDGHAVRWHRDQDGTVVIDGPLEQDAVVA